jgi:enoyl-CoA hydratase/carnithine racemase
VSYEHILFDTADGIATITLNRPEVLNAYQPQMGRDVCDAFDRVQADDSLRAIILTGAGRAFCAGVDLKFMAEYNERIAAGEELVPIGAERFVKGFAAELVASPKPIIVAFNGPAIGVGITMALPCDIRIAAEGAKLGIPFTKLGMLAGLGGSHLLPKIVGLGNAMELLLTSRIVLADEAAHMGLVNRVVPPDQLMDEARAIATRIVECNPNSVAISKRMLHEGFDMTFSEALEGQADRMGALRAGKAG